MSLLQRITTGLVARLTREPRDPEEARIPYQGRTLAGVYVTPDRALTSSVVWACVRYLSQQVAVLPWHVHQRAASGEGSKILQNHPTDWVLSGRPNREMTPFQFRETLMTWALLWGNGYAEIERDLAGRVIALWPLHPERVSVKRDEDDRLYYEVEVRDGGPVVLEPDQMFHVRGFGDQAVGVPVIQYAAQSIGWAQATMLFGAAYFGEGMNPAGVVQYKNALTTDGLARLREEFAKLYKGPRRSNRTAFLDNSATWTKLTATPDESQFVETMKHQVEEICRWFGVPPHKVMHLEKSTFNNIEHQAIEVVVDTVTPWATRFEQEANAKLFGQNRSWLFTKMNMNALLRGDFKSRVEGYRELRNMGVLSTDEIRGLEDMNPLGAEAGGDLRVMQSQYVPLERIGQVEESTAPAPDGAGDAPPADDGMARLDSLKQKFDAYGVGVRAGAISPQMQDEEQFRKEAGLPPVSEKIREVWEVEPVRRPITLSSKVESAAEMPPDEGVPPEPGEPAGDDSDEDPEELAAMAAITLMAEAAHVG